MTIGSFASSVSPASRDQLTTYKQDHNLQPRRSSMKRTLISSGFVLIVAVAAFTQGSSIKTDPNISAIISNVDAARIQTTDLALQNFRTRHACSDTPEPGHGVTAAREFIFNQYSSIPGLQVRRDPFVHPSCPNAPTYNVIAWIPGRGDPSRLVIIGGHYDSRTINVSDSTSDAPGGNDSGGQTSVVLEMARVLAGQKYHATIVLISFSGEDQ